VVSPTLRVELLEPARSLEPTLLSDLLGLVDEEGQQSSEVLVEGERLTIVGHPLDHRDRLYRWARAALERVLVPLHERHPVAHVEVTGFVSEIEP
jgi:hypothetical protein